MRGTGFMALRAVGVALAAWAGYLGLVGRGDSPLLIPVALGAISVLGTLSFLGHRERWRARRDEQKPDE